jgi:hypothetical protein
MFNQYGQYDPYAPRDDDGSDAAKYQAPTYRPPGQDANAQNAQQQQDLMTLAALQNQPPQDPNAKSGNASASGIMSLLALL